MDAKKILIIEDEKSISDIIKFNLTKEGFAIETAFNGQEGLDKALSLNPDLILLDIMLPIMDGFAVCKKIREQSNVPILMLTAKEEEVDKVLGLELGADDYITKPFGMRELIARIKANIRRSEIADNAKNEPSNVQEFGNLAIDMNRYEVRKDDKPLELTLGNLSFSNILQSGKIMYFRENSCWKKYGATNIMETFARLMSQCADCVKSWKMIRVIRNIL